jgi:hypothetical protein
MSFSYEVHELRSKSTLRDQFFLLVTQIDSEAASLRGTITALLGLPVPWQEIVEWGTLAGKEKPVRKLISQILLELGIRRRNHHGGKAPSLEALMLLNFALKNFSEDDAPKFLRAAARAVEARIKARNGLKIAVLPSVASTSPVPYGTETLSSAAMA